MEERIRNAQARFKIPHIKMMDRIQSASREQRLNAIKTFYDVAEPTKYANLTLERRIEIETSPDDKVLSFCKELCTEAINRDFVSYISTGNEGSVGKTVYNSLL
jgi:hypothetical protein